MNTSPHLCRMSPIVRRMPPIVRHITPLLTAILAGVVLWFSMRACQSLVRPLVVEAPEWLKLILNAGIEEALRLSLAIAAALAIHRLRLNPGLSSLAVLSSFLLASLENVDYLAAFPSIDVYWRIVYTMPIHMGAAALYALVTAPVAFGEPSLRPYSRRVTIIVAFLIALAWHYSFNLVAALAPFNVLPLVGGLLNVLMLSALVVALAIRYGYWSLYATR